jgi:hypothetical protein
MTRLLLVLNTLNNLIDLRLHTHTNAYNIMCDDMFDVLDIMFDDNGVFIKKKKNSSRLQINIYYITLYNAITH